MTKFKKLTAVVCAAILLSGLTGCSDAVAKLKELLQNKLGPLASFAGGLPF